MATIKENIQKYLEYKGVTPTLAERNLGWGVGAFTKAKSITVDRAKEFLLLYNDLSAEWLLREEGDMLRVNSQEVQCDECSIIRERIFKILKCKNMSTESLSINPLVQRKLYRQVHRGEAIGADVIYIILERIPAVSAEWLLRGEGKMQKEENSSYQINERESIYKELYEKKETELAENRKRIEELIAYNAKLKQELTGFTMKKIDAPEKEIALDVAEMLKSTGTGDL